MKKHKQFTKRCWLEVIPQRFENHESYEILSVFHKRPLLHNRFQWSYLIEIAYSDRFEITGGAWLLPKNPNRKDNYDYIEWHGEDYPRDSVLWYGTEHKISPFYHESWTKCKII